jgi:hypothetical protein
MEVAKFPTAAGLLILPLSPAFAHALPPPEVSRE